MEEIELFIKNLLKLAGFKDYAIETDKEHRNVKVLIYEDYGLIKDNLAVLVGSLNYIIKLVAKNKNKPFVFIDVNNYRLEREKLIIELANAAARKALATKQEIPLPAMNAYERRIAHTQLMFHPSVKTESVGSGKDRHVIVKPISE